MKKILLLLLLSFLASCQTLRKENNDNLINNARKFAIEHKYNDAIFIYDKLDDAEKLDFDEKVEYLKVLRAGHKFDEAIKLANRMLVDYKDYDYESFIEVYEELGQNHLSKANLKLAEKNFYKVVTIDAYRWKTVNSLALVYALQGKFKDSEEMFGIALDMSNRHYSVLNNYAHAKLLANNCKDAKKLFNETLNQQIPEKYRNKIEKNLKNLKCK